jgi:hypothetical protein
MTDKTRFATIDLSDPVYEWEHLRFLTFKSPVLRGRGDVTLFVPLDSENAQNLPMVVLLHGVYGSHWNWALKGGAHRTAQAMIAGGEISPMVLVMPSDGLWGDGITVALPQVCDQSPVLSAACRWAGLARCTWARNTLSVSQGFRHICRSRITISLRFFRASR